MTQPSGSAETVLLIDDDPQSCIAVHAELSAAGYMVLTLPGKTVSTDAARVLSPSVVLLNSTLDGVDSLEICRSFRRSEHTRRLPLIMLTTKASESEAVRSLEAGADDHVVKPVHARELVARIRALLRRVGRIPILQTTLTVGDLVIDSQSRIARCGENLLNLTRTEFRVLELLASRQGSVVSRTELTAVLATSAHEADRAVNSCISALRLKLSGEKHSIQTVRGFGYRLAKLVHIA